MNYQYKRFPLTPSEAQRLADACGTLLEKVLVWTFLDTGLRLSELASLRAAMIDWDNNIMLVHGKGGPYGVRSKLRVVPLTPRVAEILPEHFRHADTIGLSPRSIERHVKAIAERAAIPRPVTPHVLRHTFSVHALRRREARSSASTPPGERSIVARNKAEEERNQIAPAKTRRLARA
jgi:integrase/recombinase XerD